MNNTAKCIIVLYHSADFDGIFSREIARKHFGDSAEYIGWNYGDPIPQIPAEVEQLYMIDISIAGLMDHPALIWIDHHKTAIEKYPPTIPGYRIDGVAACRLATQWFSMLETSGTLEKRACVGGEEDGGWALPTKDQYIRRVVTEPLAIRLAGEYDIWDQRDPRANLFQHALRLPGVDLPALLADHEDDEPGEDECIIAGLLKRGEDIAYYVAERDKSHITKAGFDLRWEGLTFLACNASGYNSHLFTAGIKPHHDALLGFRWAGEKWLVSLYGSPNRPELDLSAIAARHGGGGHRQACGFECGTLPFPLGTPAPEVGRPFAKTAHQFARALLCGPDLSIFHYDPSFADACDEETDETIGTPKAEIVDPAEGMDAEQLQDAEANGVCLCPFILIVGNQPAERDRKEPPARVTKRESAAAISNIAGAAGNLSLMGVDDKAQTIRDNLEVVAAALEGTTADQDRLIFLWTLLSDEHGWGFSVRWNNSQDFAWLWTETGKIDLQTNFVDGGTDTQDTEGRTWRALIDAARAKAGKEG